MMFHCTLDQVYNIKHFEIVAMPTLFPTAELQFERLSPKKCKAKLCGYSFIINRKAQTVVH